MKRSRIADDALKIWQAGVEAVKPANCLPAMVQVDDHWFFAGDLAIELNRVDRIVIVGAGKAGAGMAHSLESVLGDKLLDSKQTTGWVNVPADCIDVTRPTKCIHLHPTRPAGVNSPTDEGAAGTVHILKLVGSLGPRDLCLVLISGGGSALLTAPVAGISVADKIAVAEEVAAAGGDIEQLNTVRRALSRVKGGGLARACRAGRLVSLVISDVPGDPLDVIASGPTTTSPTTGADALAVLDLLELTTSVRLTNVINVLRKLPSRVPKPPSCQVDHVVLANNAVAVDAAGVEAERLGYNHAMTSATKPEGPAEEVGRHLAKMAVAMRDGNGPHCLTNCLISGGEPTVKLPPANERGRGGRNQQLVLAALQELNDCDRIAFASGGTDGEDGPTDAAGAYIDASIAAAATSHRLDIAAHLKRCDAYNFFTPLGGLIQTGPTHTNVGDLRVVVVNRSHV